MKGNLVTSQRPLADGSRNKAVVRKAIAEAVAEERKAMKLEQAAKQTIDEQAAPVQKREVKTEMAAKKTTAKKTTTKAAAKTTEVKETAVKAEESKTTATPIKSVTPAKEAVKEAVKEVVKETSAKAAPVKAAAKEAVKEAKEVATKAAATAKTAAKKATVTEEVFVQYGNREIMTKDIVEKVKAAYVAEGHDADGIRKIRMYVKPEENMVYYVVNDGYASGVSLY